MDKWMKCSKKAGLIAGVVMITIIFIILVCGCTGSKEGTGNTQNDSKPLENTTQSIESNDSIKEHENITIKVVKFEPNNPCQGCTNLGNFANETIQKYFQKDYNSGKITYETVNYQDPKNIETVKKYKVVGSSLYITVIKDGKEEIIDANDMWNYVGDKEEYIKIFKNKLEQIK